MLRDLILAGCLVLPAAAVAAQSPLNLDTLVVTPYRVPTRLDQAASSVTVISHEEIQERQAVSVADLLRDVPGVAVSRSGPAGAQTQLRLRGSEANHVLVFIDGVEVNDPAAGDEFQFEHLGSADIDHIEVVRGPQSALWGSDAVGGVINVTTRRARGPLGWKAYVEGGSFDTGRGGVSVGMADNDRHFSLSGDYLDSGGSNISRSGSERDGYRSGSVRLSAGLRPATGVAVDVTGRATHSVAQLDAVDSVTGLPADADRQTDSHQQYGVLHLHLNPSGTLNQNARLTYLDTAARNYADGTRVSAVDAGKLGLYYQADLSIGASSWTGVTVAADYEQARFRQRAQAGPYGDPNQSQFIRSTGYVLAYRASPAELVNLSASLRYDDNSDFGNVFTYRVTAERRFDGGSTRAHAAWGTGQKTPTFIERFGYFPDDFLGNPDLKPEVSRGWEFGVERRLLEGRLRLGATYFSERLFDEINGFVADPGTLQFTAVNQQGTSYRQGVESELSLLPWEHLRVTAAYTYLDSTQPDGRGGQVAEIRRPRHSASLNVNYGAPDAFNLNLNVSYVGSRYDSYFPPFPRPAERRRLGAYRLVSLAASYRLTRRVAVTARVTNLLNEQYEDVLGFATPGVGGYLGLRMNP